MAGAIKSGSHDRGLKRLTKRSGSSTENPAFELSFRDNHIPLASFPSFADLLTFSSGVYVLQVLILVDIVMTSSSITAWVSDLFACIGSCFGCRIKPTPIIAVDEPAKGLRIQGKTVRKPTISDGFWSSSTCDLDNNTVQSQRSITSVSTLNQLFYHSSELPPTGTHPAFVNQGLLLWKESRIQWVGSSRTKKQNKQKQEPKLNWNATYDSLLGSKQPFPRPVPLSEMVEFLVKIWEHEGMYD